MGSAGVLLALAIFDFVRGEPPDSYAEPMFLIGLVGIASLIIAVILSLRQKKIREAAVESDNARRTLLNKFNGVTKNINDILAIDYVHCRYVAEISGGGRIRDEALISEIKHKLNTYIVEVLGHAASLFTTYTGTQCAASLKILTAEKHQKGTAKEAVAAAGHPRYVYTYARDPHSRMRRSVADATQGLEIYEWAEHAAFAEIMHSPEQHGYYCANDLKALGSKYWNINGRWREFYNALAVCALKNPANETVVEAMGFLCIDNIQGGFDDDACRDLLESIASIIYYTFITTEETINVQVEV